MKDQTQDKAHGSVPAPDGTRRRFIKAGLIAAPIIVTLSARPAWATNTTNGSIGNYGSATNGEAPNP
jgi:hypothetical protein